MLARIGGDEFVCALPYEPRRPRADRPVRRPADRSRVASRSRTATCASKRPSRSASPASGDDGRRRPRCRRRDADPPRRHRDVPRQEAAAGTATTGSSRRWRASCASAASSKPASAAASPRGEFVPYYEQQIDLETGELVGFEMLARWNSPQFGLVSPEIFIPIAEEIDVIAELSEALIRQALRRRQGVGPEADAVGQHLAGPAARSVVRAEAAQAAGRQRTSRRSRLEIEITESCLHENIGAVRTIVTSLKNQGIRISLDDFGTGYCEPVAAALAAVRPAQDRPQLRRRAGRRRGSATSWSRRSSRSAAGCRCRSPPKASRPPRSSQALQQHGPAQGPGLSLRPARGRRGDARAARRAEACWPRRCRRRPSRAEPPTPAAAQGRLTRRAIAARARAAP